MIIVLMGVSGSGKTTVGRLLAETLGWPFYDGDQFHPVENIEKMRQGIPLNDRDRASWLRVLRKLIEAQMAANQSTVLACSALKQAYREQLTPTQGRVEFVYLKGTAAQIHERLTQRSHHFMNDVLLESQFDTLEEPANDLVLDITLSPSAIVTRICNHFNLA